MFRILSRKNMTAGIKCCFRIGTSWVGKKFQATPTKKWYHLAFSQNYRQIPVQVSVLEIKCVRFSNVVMQYLQSYEEPSFSTKKIR